MATVFVVEAADKQATMLKAKTTMEKDRLIQYYCSEDFLELYLGNFRICDRPKRMIFRFLSEENLLEDCETSSPVKPGIRPNDLFLFSPDERQYSIKMNIKNKSPTKTNNNNINMIYRNDNKKAPLSNSFLGGAKSNSKKQVKIFMISKMLGATRKLLSTYSEVFGESTVLLNVAVSIENFLVFDHL